MSYGTVRRHPKWQKRRLEIMQRDSWTCASCHGDDVPLNVHHRRYIRGRKPWEYCDKDLITLCDDCHGKTHEICDGYKTLTTEGKIKLLDRLIGDETVKHKWGPFLIFREPKISDGCVIFHIPSALWHAFVLPPEAVADRLETHPESRSELLQMILEGLSTRSPECDYD